MSTRKKNLLFRSEVNGKVLTLTEGKGVYELTLTAPGKLVVGPNMSPKQVEPSVNIAIALIDPTVNAGGAR